MIHFYVYIYLNPLKPGKFIYEALSFDFEPFYVGKGSNDRLNVHIKYGSNNPIMKGTLKKIKEQNLEPIIFKPNFNLLEEQAWDLEKFYIKTIGRRDLGLGPLANMRDGGEGGSLSEETKAKISKAKKGQNKGIARSEETKAKISKTLKGKKFSKETRKKMSEGQKRKLPISEETRKKMSESQTGRKHSESSKKKMSESQTGRKHSEETRRKISKNHVNVSGENNPMFGRKFSEETRKKMSESAKNRKK